jgi:hypothetical protein
MARSPRNTPQLYRWDPTHAPEPEKAALVSAPGSDTPAMVTAARGWRDPDAPGHVGAVIGLIEKDPLHSGDPPRVHELRSPGDAGRPRTAVQLFQASCSCGWRSMRFRAPASAFWEPFSTELGDQDLERCARGLWQRHWRVPEALGARATVRVPLHALPRAAAPAETDGFRLELGDDAGGPRFFLDGQAIHAGSCLDLLLADGLWLRGRYEYELDGDDLRPMFYVAVPCKTGAPDWAGDVEAGVASPEAHFQIPADALLRWPP